MKKIYYAAAYIRLSREDGDKEESDSISTQKKLIADFVGSKEDIELYDNYIDDGYTGTNFSRPGFLQMMKDIENGFVNCVIVKDLSRFGRDYIDTGRYLERIFPELGVRFIAVTDDVDSLGQPYDMLIPLKNIFNAQYSKDISKKVHSAMNTKQKAGEFIGAFASYGYKKDIHNKNRLVIDEYAAGVVKRIYHLYLSGIGQIKIAAMLNDEGILCPSEYKRLNGENYSNSNRKQQMKYWTYSTVHKILQNRMYIGDMVQGKTVQNMRKKAKQVAPENWIIVENTHEAIIDRDIWNRVQTQLKIRTRELDIKNNLSAFAGLIKCGDCGSAMVKNSSMVDGKKYVKYYCGAYKRSGRCYCTPHAISHNTLEKIVLSDFKTILSHINNIAEIVESERKKAEKNTIKRSNAINQKRTEDELQRIKNLKKAIYEDYKDGLITKEEYQSYKQDYIAKEELLEKQLDTVVQPVYKSAQDIYKVPWIKKLLELKEVDSINRDIAVEMIYNIQVFEDKRIKITYNFSKDLENLFLTSVPKK